MKKLGALPIFLKYRLLKFCVFTVALLFFYCGCAAVPQKEFEIYRNNFHTAKSSAEDITLSAIVAAEEIARSPDHPDGPNVRQKKLEERIAALNARLQALELIEQYNEVIVNLASGTDPAAIKSSLENLNDGLSSFGISQISKIAAEATPLFGVISQAVAIIDDLIKKEKFKEAVYEGQKPVLGIIDILHGDADNIHEIQIQIIGLKQDTDYERITSLKKRLSKLSNSFQKSGDLDKLIDGYNKFLKRLRLDNETVKELKVQHYPVDGAHAPPNATELETLQTIADQISEHINSYNNYADQIIAHNEVITQYKNLLITTRNAFINLNSAVRSNQRAATVVFIAKALNFRKAIIEYKETRQK